MNKELRYRLASRLFSAADQIGRSAKALYGNDTQLGTREVDALLAEAEETIKEVRARLK